MSAPKDDFDSLWEGADGDGWGDFDDDSWGTPSSGKGAISVSKVTGGDAAVGSPARASLGSAHAVGDVSASALDDLDDEIDDLLGLSPKPAPAAPATAPAAATEMPVSEGPPEPAPEPVAAAAPPEVPLEPLVAVAEPKRTVPPEQLMPSTPKAEPAAPAAPAEPATPELDDTVVSVTPLSTEEPEFTWSAAEQAAQAARRGHANIQHLVVVGFHHTKGHVVEFVYPPFRADEPTDTTLPAVWRHLPHEVLPTGMHHRTAGTAFFTVPTREADDTVHTAQHHPLLGRSLAPPPRTADEANARSAAAQVEGRVGGLEGSAAPPPMWYGVTCFQQEATDSLATPTPDPDPAAAAEYTRSHVQKGVAVLSTRPCFGWLSARLRGVTAAWFEDMTNTAVLRDFVDACNTMDLAHMDPSQLFMDLCPRRLVHTVRHNTLMLVKMLMLQRRVLLYSADPQTVSNTVVSLAALCPGLLTANAADAMGVPAYAVPRGEADALAAYQLPLRIFDQQCFIQPLFTLEQVELMRKPSHAQLGFLAGVTNQWFVRERPAIADVVLDLDSNTLHVHTTDSQLRAAAHLSVLDRLFMDGVVKVVDATWGDDAASEDAFDEMTFEASGDWIRLQFRAYTECFLSSFAATPHVLSGRAAFGLVRGSIDWELLSDWSVPWVRAWTHTRAFKHWIRYVPSAVASARPRGHIIQHSAFFVADYTRYVASRARENPVMQRVGAALGEVGGRVRHSQAAATAASLVTSLFKGEGGDADAAPRRPVGGARWSLWGGGAESSAGAPVQREPAQSWGSWWSGVKEAVSQVATDMATPLHVHEERVTLMGRDTRERLLHLKSDDELRALAASLKATIESADERGDARTLRIRRDEHAAVCSVLRERTEARKQREAQGEAQGSAHGEAAQGEVAQGSAHGEAAQGAAAQGSAPAASPAE